MSLQTFLQLDLSKKSATAKDLFDRLPREAAQSNIALTPFYSTDEMPPFLSQEMSSWYASNVQALRSGAIQDVALEFKRRNRSLVRARAGSDRTGETQ